MRPPEVINCRCVLCPTRERVERRQRGLARRAKSRDLSWVLARPSPADCGGFRKVLEVQMLERGLDLAGMARFLGIAPATLAGWLQGTQGPQVKSALRIADRLGLTLETLWWPDGRGG